MFLRCNRRKNDGKVHDCWNVMESRRCSEGRVVQRQELYLGEVEQTKTSAKHQNLFD